MDDPTAPAWVPFADSLQWMLVDRHICRHTRPASGSDTARGAVHIKEGSWRIEYRINRSSPGVGIVLGVADVDAPAWTQKPKEVAADDGKKDAKAAKKDKKGKDAAAEPEQTFKPGKPSIAWGLCTSSGRLVSTHDPKVGRFGGACVGEQMTERRTGAVAGMTVVVECDIPQHRSSVDALVSRKSFCAGLHPLDAPRDFPLHLQTLSMRTVQHLTGKSPVTRPASLSFSIDGGERHSTNVHLPAAGVYVSERDSNFRA